jgi:hypothetical protein
VRAHRLHDVLERVETDVARGGLDLGVHGHGETLKGRGEDEGPLAAQERHLDREQGEDGADDAGQVDVDVLAVRVGDGGLAGGDVVLEENDGEETAREVEGPVVALMRVESARLVCTLRGETRADSPCRPGRGGQR